MNITTELDPGDECKFLYNNSVYGGTVNKVHVRVQLEWNRLHSRHMPTLDISYEIGSHNIEGDSTALVLIEEKRVGKDKAALLAKL